MVVSEQIIQVLNYLGEKFGIAIDWTSDNVIPYLTTLCTKLVTWEIWSSVAWIGIMAVLGIIAIIFIAVNKQQLLEFMSEDSIFAGLVVALCVMLFVAVIGVIGTQIFDIIKCITFPEMHVVEYIQHLIKTSK